MFNILNMEKDGLDKYVIIAAIERVLAFSNKAYSVRGLAKELRISVGSAKAALDFMHKRGIVKNSAIGRSYQYRADLENALCRQWKILFNVAQVQRTGILNGILEKSQDVQSVLLYGSLAKGTNDDNSDMDVLVVAHKMPKNRQIATKMMWREPNVSWITLDDWKKKAREDKVFYENVIYDSIVLYGQRPVVV